jgi:hypothetical protein
MPHKFTVPCRHRRRTRVVAKTPAINEVVGQEAEPFSVYLQELLPSTK